MQLHLDLDFASADTPARIIYAGEQMVWRQSTGGENAVKNIRTIDDATIFNHLSNTYSGTNLSPTPNYSDFAPSLWRTFDTMLNVFPQATDPTREHTIFIFDADPNLVIGQTFYVFEENENGNTSS